MTTGIRDALQEADHLHRLAMEHLASGDLSRFEDRQEEAAGRERAAFRLGVQAADRVAATDIPEPSRSVFHRSAASVAIRVGEYQAAERLIHRALQGNPPQEIAWELEELLIGRWV